ncbi:MAG: carboxypeptidase-like regulatory domain-containing protein [Paludibacter sp.]|nr:carboxypeptidase-like regulatory domain-containing protein [Paludibacter sp.]
MIKKDLIFAMLLFISVQTAFAQSFSGKVVDSENVPISYVNVVLLSEDSAFIEGTITDTTGIFVLKNMNNNGAFVKFTHVQYNDTLLSVQDIIESGNIVLSTNEEVLSEVTVIANDKVFSIQKGVFAVNVASSKLLSDSPNMDRLMNKIPFVYGGSGSYEVFGAGNAEVYLNGRKLLDNSILESLLPSEVEKIEIIRNPDVKYGINTKAVIIITTKKIQNKYALTLTQLLQMYNKFSSYSGVNFVLASNKIDWNIRFGYSNTNMETESQSTITTLTPEHNFVIEEQAKQPYNSDYFMTGVGMNYAINKTSNVGFSTSLNFGNMKNYFTPQMMRHFTDTNQDFEASLYSYSKSLPKKSSTNLYFNGKIKKPTSILLTI